MIEFLEPLLTGKGIITLVTLALLEVVLGIDNIVFISILSGRLAPEDQRKTRMIGLSLALIMRVILLFFISWIVSFSQPLVSNLFGMELDISVHDLIMFAGGLFLLYKATTEIHGRLEGEDHVEVTKKAPSVTSAIFQIILLDMVFSFDSILTAIGLVDDPTKDLSIMILAVVISIIVMLLFAKYITDFINKHPTVKMLALSFLLMIGVLLVVEAFHVHVPKGYVYFAMAFSLFVEVLNMRARKKSQPVKLKSLVPDSKEETVEEEK